MRLIVSCSKCCRRYNVQGRRPGARLRCLCGESLTVSAPRGHDAAVVRCSSCGAPREEGADACGHCRSDFTLHERDLDSVCPACLARVSDKARYCHHCAAPLFAENVAGEKTDLRCPVCAPKRRLVSRRLGDFPVAVLECQRCAGLWLGLEAFEEMLAAESRGDKPGVNHSPGSARDTPPTTRGYRPCIVCGELMSRKNLARGKSGIVVDVCGRHGVWFDADELAQLIAWTRTGGLEDLRRDLARLVGSKDSVRKRHVLEQEQPQRQARSEPRPSTNSAPQPTSACDSDWIDLLGQIARGLLLRKIIR